MTDASPSFRRTALLLSGAGALPFIGLVIAMAILEAPTNSTAGLWLQTYAAVILSFLGGIRWGTAIAAPPSSPLPLAISVLPALAGWAMLPLAIILQPGPNWYLGYALAFALQLAWDWRSAAVPAWFKPIRLGVSLVVISSLIGAWAVQTYLF
ncbi:DUF3429 domain-containing protein [Henriciella litoralis]|uniref:DUF3429 domain-containing protein n=1 Tax=Henriciella litoralis TaxID=568102 RepID=UPI000A042D55|nr:DUF3429 domain-containing protein [Henriciella litoralis]